MLVHRLPVRDERQERGVRGLSGEHRGIRRARRGIMAGFQRRHDSLFRPERGQNGSSAGGRKPSDILSGKLGDVTHEALNVDGDPACSSRGLSDSRVMAP